MFPREHVDDVHLPGVPIIGRKYVPHRLLERLAEEWILHKDDTRVFRHRPIHNASDGAFDRSGTPFAAGLLNIRPSDHSQFAINLDADDSLIRNHPGDQ